MPPVNKNLQNLIQTETSCHQLLKELRFANGNFACANCHHSRAYEISGRPNVYECSHCGKQTSLTAGTFFHGKKLPLKKCFELLFSFLGKKPVSTSQLAKDLDLWESTVWRWSQQLRMILNDLFVDDDSVVVDVAFLKRVLFRRSVETPAIDSAEHNVSTEPEDELRSEEERLCVLETQGYVSTVHHGVSKKYAQLYAAEFRFFLRAKEQNIMSLLGLILHAGPVSVETVSAYSSPKLVVLPSRTRA